MQCQGSPSRQASYPSRLYGTSATFGGEAFGSQSFVSKPSAGFSVNASALCWCTSLALTKGSASSLRLGSIKPSAKPSRQASLLPARRMMLGSHAHGHSEHSDQYSKEMLYDMAPAPHCDHPMYYSGSKWHK